MGEFFSGWWVLGWCLGWSSGLAALAVGPWSRTLVLGPTCRPDAGRLPHRAKAPWRLDSA